DHSGLASQHYAETVRIHLERPANNPNLVTVETSIGIACGDDSSLYVFGANGHFSFSVSPPDRGGHWYALAARMSPQCASLWRPMTYEVLRPSRDPWHPDILLNGSETA